jgi:hypothetical protein
MNWGMNGKFYTDSYDSSQTHGEYPGGTIDDSNPTAVHSNGDIGTGSDQSQAITLNGGTVNGTAETPTGTAGIDQSTSVTGGVTTSPAINWEIPVPPSTLGWPYYSSAPANIAVSGNTQIHVTSAGALTFSGSGNVTLVIDSNWNTRNGSIVIPPGVHATVYVGGSMDFGTGSVNDPNNPLNSGRPQDLQIYGCSETGASFNISTNGTPVISAAVYAPGYDFILKGGGIGVFYGSLIANSYSMNGGGNIAFHYDESLANVGAKRPVSYSRTSYFEDQRL